ncbi:hypothetical protein BWI17_03875 [Betaproteobacteria bacterium GR16-43]|nr:hypothetical protein BWI17_03875 [Betaproteobacteria bacterium GR16-43]
MNNVQRKEIRDDLRAVEYELRSWDPIGVILDPDDPDAPLDEYDSYAPVVLKFLRDGAAADALARHLHKLTTEHMGVPLPLERSQKYAESLIGWWKARKKGINAV